MYFSSSWVIFLLLYLGMHFAFSVAQGDPTSQCSTKTAEPCLEARQLKYSNALKAYYEGSADTALKFEELGPQICLSQIREDSDGNCFETNTELCAKGEATSLKRSWDNLNNNITDLCEKVCPNFLQIGGCKNLTFSEELKDSRFEKFCRTFNASLRCATTALADCEFGMTIYYAALEQQIMPYWKQICNSGCPNIDQTVGVIKACAKPLQDIGNKPNLDDLCRVHYNFKQCVFGSPDICQEQVMVLVNFMYRKYYRIDTLCLTTTSTTTQPTTTAEISTTKGTTITTTAENSARKETTLNDYYDDIVTDDLDPRAYINCISEERIEKMTSEEQLNAPTALNLMELEECIYRNLTAGNQDSTLAVSLYHIPPALWDLYRSYKENGYHVIMTAIKEKCHSNVPSGCTGHRYGLIECESSGAIQCCTTVLKILSLFILISIAS